MTHKLWVTTVSKLWKCLKWMVWKLQYDEKYRDLMDKTCPSYQQRIFEWNIRLKSFRIWRLFLILPVRKYGIQTR